MFAIVKEHEDGSVTVPAVSDSYSAAINRAFELRDEEYATMNHDDWETRSDHDSGVFECVSVGDETWTWYVTQVEEVLD